MTTALAKAKKKLMDRSIAVTVMKVKLPSGETVGALVPDENVLPYGEKYRALFKEKRFRRPDIDRFNDLHSVDAVSGCWNWKGSRVKGYGRFNVADFEHEQILAHRWSYGYFVGPIPDGLSIDHLCRNRRCCNPSHLEPVTHRENNIRTLPYRKIATDEACKHGHPWTTESTYIGPGGHRDCRICRQISWRKTMAKRMEMK